jgi:hypothetical protein
MASQKPFILDAADGRIVAEGYKEVKGFFGPSSEIPPTGVGGWFRSGLQRDRLQKFRNPTNGSWWMLQIQPVHVEGL